MTKDDEQDLLLLEGRRDAPPDWLTLPLWDQRVACIVFAMFTPYDGNWYDLGSDAEG